MALANKEHMQNNSSTMAIIQASAFYEHDFGPKLIHSSPQGIYPDHQSPKKVPKNFALSNSSSVSSPSSSNSNGLIYNLSEEAHSVINFKPEFPNFSGSFLSFDQTKRALPYPKMLGDEDEYPAVWESDLHFHMDPKSTRGPPETSSSHHAAADYGSPSSGVQVPWLNDQEIIGDGVQETSNNKRPSTVIIN